MSSTTQRLKGVIAYLPRFLRPAEPRLVDGLLELERAYQIMSLLVDLPETSQARVIWHVERITLENAQLREDFRQREAANEAAPPAKADDSVAA
jgi:hypothetical protein